MKTAVKREGKITGQLMGQISKQAAAWSLPSKMVADWLKQHDASQLSDLNQMQGLELLAALDQMKAQHDAEPATKVEIQSLREYCKSMRVAFEEIYTYSMGYVTTRADIRDMRQKVRDLAQERARVRQYSGNAGEQHYYKHNPVRLS